MSLLQTDAHDRISSLGTRGVLEIDRVSKTFVHTDRTVEVLRNISVTVAAGETLAIVGASGSGKSTLLRLILGLDTDFQGEIRLDGRRVVKAGLDRGMVFQDHRLLPWLTVEDNVAAALRRSGLSKAEKSRLVTEHLAIVGLGDASRAWPSQLSGGMSQRVAIARALVNRPRFLLLDEPFGALDALTRLRLQDELARIIRHEGNTVVLVTHDVDEAVLLADRILVLQPNPGRIERVVDVGADVPRDRSSSGFLHVRDDVLDALGVRSMVRRARIPEIGPD